MKTILHGGRQSCISFPRNQSHVVQKTSYAYSWDSVHSPSWSQALRSATGHLVRWQEILLLWTQDRGLCSCKKRAAEELTFCYLDCHVDSELPPVPSPPSQVPPEQSSHLHLWLDLG